MPKKTDNKDSFDNYQSKIDNVNLGLYSRQNLTPLSDSEAKINDDNIAKLVAEGEKLIEAEEKMKTSVKIPSNKVDSKLAASSSNPYVRARIEILDKMSPERKSIIEAMERGTREKNHIYDDFCKDVAKRGDQLSNNN